MLINDGVSVGQKMIQVGIHFRLWQIPRQASTEEHSFFDTQVYTAVNLN